MPRRVAVIGRIVLAAPARIAGTGRDRPDRFSGARPGTLFFLPARALGGWRCGSYLLCYPADFCQPDQCGP